MKKYVFLAHGEIIDDPLADSEDPFSMRLVPTRDGAIALIELRR